MIPGFQVGRLPVAPLTWQIGTRADFREAFERAAAGFLLLAALPVLAVSGLAIFALSGRSPLIAHRRVGLNGRDLWVWKLRTMWRRRGAYDARLLEYIADDDGPARKSPGDRRVMCGFARFCRRHSIDELPQLLNVVRGEMALIGPRPVTRREMRQIFGAAAEEIVRVKPGITGLWQVSGRNRLTAAQRRALDLELVRRRSPGMCASILLRTLPELIGGNNSW
ncbi:MAG: sugar transferase [Acidobacteriota bacterium]|nr:sugar transferase [Acidobacteriota bacterium]